MSTFLEIVDEDGDRLVVEDGADYLETGDARRGHRLLISCEAPDGTGVSVGLSYDAMCGLIDDLVERIEQ